MELLNKSVETDEILQKSISNCYTSRTVKINHSTVKTTSTDVCKCCLTKISLIKYPNDEYCNENQLNACCCWKLL